MSLKQNLVMTEEANLARYIRPVVKRINLAGQLIPIKSLNDCRIGITPFQCDVKPPC